MPGDSQLIGSPQGSGGQAGDSAAQNGAQAQGVVPSFNLDEQQETNPQLEGSNVVSFDLDQPAPTVAENNNMIDNIVAQATKREEPVVPTVTSTIDSETLSKAEITSLELELKNNAHFAVVSRNILVGLVLLGTLMVGYFTFRFQSAEQSAFKANLNLAEVTETNTELMANYNLQIYEIVNHHLQELTWDSLSYLRAFDLGQTQDSEQAKANIQRRLQQIQAIMQKLSILNSDDPQQARLDLISQLSTEQRAQHLEEVIRNRPLHSDLNTPEKIAAIGELNAEDYRNWLASFLGEIKSEPAKLAQLHNSRLHWSKILSELESEVRKVDPNFGSDNNLIDFSNYNVNSTTQQISVTGQLRTADPKTFTLIAELLDTISANPHFRNLQTRSFSKNTVEEVLGEDANGQPTEVATAYEASLQLDFEFVTDQELADTNQTQTTP